MDFLSDLEDLEDLRLLGSLASLSRMRHIHRLNHLRRMSELENFCNFINFCEMMEQRSDTRRDPTTSGDLSDADFLRIFRFSKAQVNDLATMLHSDLSHSSDRGRPLSPVQQVCIALNYYAGGDLVRVSALCGGVSQSTACRAVTRVSHTLCTRKADHMRLPTDEKRRETAARMLAQFDLPGFAYGVGGVLVRFETAPRRIPEGSLLRIRTILNGYRYLPGIWFPC